MVLVAPFLSSVQVELSTFALSSPYGEIQRLSIIPWECWKWDVQPETFGPALVERHEALGVTLVPDRLLTGERLLDSTLASLNGASSLRIQLSVGPYGVGCFMLWCEEATLQQAAEIERFACEHIHGWAREISSFLGTHLRCAVPVNTSHLGRFPIDTFLWWHRIIWSPSAGPPSAELAIHLQPSTQSELGPSCSLQVANGYTYVSGGTRSDFRSAVSGVVEAEELWLTGDLGTRDVVLEIARVQGDGRTTARSPAASANAARKVAEHESLRNALSRDQINYITGPRRTALDTAIEAWGMEYPSKSLDDNLALLQKMLDQRLADARLRQQRRLSLLVLALGVATSFEFVLGIFNTAVGGRLELHGGRVFVAGLISALAAASLALLTMAIKREKF